MRRPRRPRRARRWSRGREPFTMDHARPGCCTWCCCARRTRMPGSARSTLSGVPSGVRRLDARRRAVDACSRPAATRTGSRTRTTRGSSTTSCASRPAGGGGSGVERGARPRPRRGAIVVDYEVLPAVFDAEEALAPGAPLVHGDKDADARGSPTRRATSALRAARRGRRRRGGVRGGGRGRRGDVPRRRACSTRSLETHGATAWIDERGRLNVRTSTQVPFLVRDELARLLGVEVRVFTARVGGGFGGKQEMLVEDVVALAALRTGRPVRLELTREEQFAATTTRHAMRVRVRAGARRRRRADRAGALAAVRHRRLRQPRPGRDVPRVRRVARRLPLPEQAGRRRAWSTRTPSRPARSAATGSRQTIFAVESVLDELARRLGWRRACARPQRRRARRRLVPRRGRRDLGSQLRARPVPGSRRGVAGARRRSPVPGPDWLVGEGIALGMLDAGPPGGHVAEARVERLSAGATIVGRDGRVRQRDRDRAPADRGFRSGVLGRLTSSWWRVTRTWCRATAGRSLRRGCMSPGARS